MSEAIGALMAGVVLSESGVREEIEQRFFAVRDVFAALFFFVFALTIELDRAARRRLDRARSRSSRHLVGKVGVGVVAGRLGGFSVRQGSTRARRSSPTASSRSSSPSWRPGTPRSQRRTGTTSSRSPVSTSSRARRWVSS